MRILLVTHTYPPFGLAGVERLSEQTALALTAAGHEVTVLTRRAAAAPPVPRLERTERRGIPVLMISGGAPWHGRFPQHAPTLERLFERTLIEIEPDLVLISHLLGHSPTYVSIAHRWRIPVVIELHDFYVACERAHLERPTGELCRGPEGGRACAVHCFPDQPRALERWALRSHLFRQAIENADALVCPSRFVAEYFRDVFGTNMPVHVIGNGVQEGASAANAPSAEGGGLRLACIGVVTPHKGAHVVLEALRKACLPDVRLTLFGAVTQPYFREVAETAGRIENLEFLAYGAFDPGELPLLLADVDAVIIPSLVWETYSIVCREAMACGVPVVASRLGALPEAIREGENGLLFEPGSAVELAVILQTLDRDPALLNVLRAGIRPTDWLSVDERTRRLQAVLAHAIAGKDQISNDAGAFQELSILRDALPEGAAAT
jgi:glycosyltransferase involved in cell wall biosynthesis